jgi:hypothetical protein
LLGEPADHEEAALKALDLPPAVASAGLIRQVAPLGDDALDAHAARLFEDVAATPLDVLGIADASCFRGSEELEQAPLSLLERESIDTLSLQLNEVERKVDEVTAGGTAGHGPLHRFEAAASAGEHHDQLAINQPLRDPKRAKRINDFRKLRRPVQSTASDQPDAAISDETAHTIPIELDLVHPFVT